MRDVILKSGNQLTHSMEVNKGVRVEGKIDEIILVGMGGSGHPGSLINSLNINKVPLRVHRSYDLPRVFGKNPLIIASSYSGNTEEALSAYEAAQAAGYSLMVNTAGGTIAKWAERDGVPVAKIDFTGMQPRHTLFASFTGMATVLWNSGLAEDISDDIRRVEKVLEKEIPDLEVAGKEMAKNLKGKTPVYTASDTLSFAAHNFKIQTNENSKTPAFYNIFPELNHNELVGFSKPQADFYVLMLLDDDDHPRIKARMSVTAELYKEWGIGVGEFVVKGSTLLEKIMYTISYEMWTTYYLAKEYGVDPLPVEGVEKFKSRLKEVAG